MNDELAISELRAALGCTEDRSVSDLAKVALNLRHKADQVDKLAHFRLEVRKLHAWVEANQEKTNVQHVALGLYALLSGNTLELPDLPP